MELLAELSMEVYGHHYSPLRRAAMLSQMTLEFTFKAVGILGHAPLIAGIRTIAQWAAVHHPGVFWNVVMSAAP